MPIEKEVLYIIKCAINYLDIDKTQQEVCPEINKEYLRECMRVWDDLYYRLMYNY